MKYFFFLWSESWLKMISLTVYKEIMTSQGQVFNSINTDKRWQEQDDDDHVATTVVAAVDDDDDDKTQEWNSSR